MTSFEATKSRNIPLDDLSTIIHKGWKVGEYCPCVLQGPPFGDDAVPEPDGHSEDALSGSLIEGCEDWRGEAGLLPLTHEVDTLLETWQ